MNALQRAMINADASPDVIALTAIEAELIQVETPGTWVPDMKSAPIEPGATHPAPSSAPTGVSVEIEAQRQRDLDAALADAVEVVARHRQRLGRRICSRNDGRIIRAVFDQLRAMSGPDALFNDPGFDGSLGT
jgi:hypothetical protein